MNRSTAIIAASSLILGLGLGWSLSGSFGPSSIVSPSPDEILSEIVAASRIESKFERLTALTELLVDVSSTNVMGALVAIEETSVFFEAQERNLVLARIAEVEVATLADTLRNWGDDEELQKAAVMVVLREYSARRRFQRAVEYWDKLPEKYRQFGAVILVQSMVRADDLESATRFTMSLDDSQERAMRVITATLAQEGDPGAIREWAEALPEETRTDVLRKRALVIHALRDMARIDAVGAATWAAEIVDEPYAYRPLAVVAPMWIERDSDAAMRWILGLPDGPLRDETLSAALYRWSAVDEPALAAWLDAAEIDLNVDPIVIHLIRRIANKRPLRAAAWVERIATPEIKAEAERLIGKSWLKKDFHGARKWLAASSLPADEVEKLVAEERRRLPMGTEEEEQG